VGKKIYSWHVDKDGKSEDHGLKTKAFLGNEVGFKSSGYGCKSVIQIKLHNVLNLPKPTMQWPLIKI
jgi:hypothetical protein